MALGTRLGALAGALAVGLLVGRRAGGRAAVAVALAWVAATLLKAAFARPRLSAAALGAAPREVTGSFAYPSSHAALAFALAASLSLSRPRAAPWALGLALVVALARMVAGVHTPLDLVGGAALGAAAARLVAVADDAIAAPARRSPR
ncbi:MAG: phosphatase PAP2 family protein [Acidimicrobiales bacterium]